MDNSIRNLRIACFCLALLNLCGFLIMSLEINVRVVIAIYLMVIILTIIMTAILAKKLKRSVLGWGIFSFFMPWLSSFIIAFVGEKQKTSAGWFRTSTTGSYGSTFLSTKSCSACGRNVSVSSAAGQRCPHCGAYWSTERRIN